MNRVTIEQKKGRTIENNRVSKNSVFLLWVNYDPWAYIIPKGGFSHSLELRSLPPPDKNPGSAPACTLFFWNWCYLERLLLKSF